MELSSILHTIAGSFLQSEAWQHIQGELGRPIWRHRGMLLISHEMRFGWRYLYTPRPFIPADMPLGELIREIQELTRASHPLCLRIDPREPLPPTDMTLRPSHSLQPRKTVILDLAKSKDELFAAMHEKTRYNIRLAERKGVSVTNVLHARTHEDLEIFWHLLEKTAARNTFRTHKKQYYEILSAAHSSRFSNMLFFALSGHEVIASAMVNVYADPATGAAMATYLHGASSHEHRNAMAPHLMHWRIIQEMKTRGVAGYDLWGIDERRWPGLTRFKLGFGGTVVEYPETVDVVFRKFGYGLYRSVGLLRRK